MQRHEAVTVSDAGDQEKSPDGGIRKASPSRRRAWVDPGRWLLERQRFALPPTARPRAPDRVTPISSLIPQLIEHVQKTAHLHVDELDRIWGDVAGAMIAKHARPGTLEKGFLTVYVDHSMWLSELQRFHGAALLDKVRRAYPQGKVRKIVFRLDPDLERGGRERR